MRAIYCFCGHRIEGETDTDLFHHYCDHTNQAHPTERTTETQMWAVIKANASELPHHHDQHSTTHDYPSL